jgi:glycosyl transferase family 25
VPEKPGQALQMNKMDPKSITFPTYLINLDGAKDRLSLMQAKCELAGLPFERVPAVEGKELSFPIDDFQETAYTFLHGRRRNPGEIGCYLSHIECARRLLASEAQYALILEDDLTFPPDLHQLLQGAVSAAEDWDILRLSTVNSGKKYPFRRISPQRSLALALTREKGSGAYLINRRAAHWFVERLLPMQLPFDLAFDIEYLAGLRSVFVTPVPIGQDTGLPSQIQGKRRALHLSRWHYLIVHPYRAWLETSRFTIRSCRLVRSLLKNRHSQKNGSLTELPPFDYNQREPGGPLAKADSQ